MAGTLIVQFKDQMRCQAGGRGAAMALIHLLKISRPVQKIDQYRLQESIDVGVVPSHGLFLVDFNPRDRVRWVMVFFRLDSRVADEFKAIGASLMLTPKCFDLSLELIGHIQLEFVPVIVLAIVVLEFATGFLDCSSVDRDSNRMLLPTGEPETVVAGVVVADDRVVVGIQRQ
jgi:hypothetical protein